MLNIMSETWRQHILNAISDLVSDFVYYDRKSDEDLRVGSIEESIKLNEITVNEIIEAFKNAIQESIKWEFI